MNIFISQPMHGLTTKEINDTREKAVKTVKAGMNLSDDACHVLETVFDDAPDGAKPLWYLGESIKYLSNADIAVFLPGWKDARGCRIEHECAESYGVTVMELWPTEDSAE